jgi:hypothetical protein
VSIIIGYLRLGETPESLVGKILRVLKIGECSVKDRKKQCLIFREDREHCEGTPQF